MHNCKKKGKKNLKLIIFVFQVYATHIFDGLGDWATHIAHVTDGTCLSLHSVADFPELEKIKQEHRKRESSDSPLTTVCLGWLREDRDRLRNKKPIDPTTGLPHTKWDDMSENMKANGDKYFNYWKQPQ
jgi:CCR4-NOT complex subunit CAF16